MNRSRYSRIQAGTNAFFFSLVLTVVSFAILSYSGLVNAQDRGSIAVYSTPTAGANIFLDYIGDTGQTTNSTLNQVSPGSHAVYIQHPSYTPAPPPQEGIQVTAGQTATATFELQTSTAAGSISVISAPETGANIYLDYRDTGLLTSATPTPVAVINPVSAGTHYVLLRKRPTCPYTAVKAVKVATGGAETVIFELPASTDTGTITVQSIPNVADIYLDYLPTTLQTTDTLTDMAYGTYAVTVKKSGYLLPPPQTVELSASTPATTINFTLLSEWTPTPTPSIPTATPTAPTPAPTATPTAPQPTPTATPTSVLVLNASATEVAPGDNFSISLVINEPISGFGTVTGYVVVLMPNGVWKSFVPNGRGGFDLVPGVVPAATTSMIPALNRTLLALTIPENLLRGDYWFAAGIFPQGVPISLNNWKEVAIYSSEITVTVD
jgi:hypothetical protein